MHSVAKCADLDRTVTFFVFFGGGADELHYSETKYFNGAYFCMLQPFGLRGYYIVRRLGFAVGLQVLRNLSPLVRVSFLRALLGNTKLTTE